MSKPHLNNLLEYWLDSPAWMRVPSDDPRLLPPDPPRDARLFVAADQPMMDLVREAAKTGAMLVYHGIPVVIDDTLPPGTHRWSRDGT
jgi:hypothetical protein